MKPRPLIACGLMLAALWAHAQPAATPGDAAALAALAELSQEMMAIGRPLQGNLGGPVRFVHGNDLWQPGRQFTAGPGWLALACVASRCALRPAALAVTAASWQGHYDDRPTRGQKLRFSLAGSEQPNTRVLAWFAPRQAIDFLSPGEVTSYPEVDAVKGSFDAVVRTPQGDARFVPLLWSAKEWPASEGLQLPALQAPALLLQLRMAGRRQLLPGVLGSCAGDLRGAQYLLWAGDLDRDGKPDYLVSYIDESGDMHLYLSSRAKPGQLVGLGGVHASPPYGGECDGNQLMGR